eukprot:UN08270
MMHTQKHIKFLDNPKSTDFEKEQVIRYNAIEWQKQRQNKFVITHKLVSYIDAIVATQERQYLQYIEDTKEYEKQHRTYQRQLQLLNASAIRYQKKLYLES